MRKKILCLLMVLAMVMTTVPAAAFASEAEQMSGTAAENCEVTVNFDISSLGTDEALSVLEFEKIPSGKVTVPKGATLEEALIRLDNASDAIRLTKTDGMITAVNHVTGKSQDNAFAEMLEKLGAAPVPAEFQYAGWMYNGDGLQGMGINSDIIQQDTIVDFRYTLYYGAAGGGEWKNYDWEFVDAFNALNAKVEEARTLDKNEYSDEEWTKVAEAQTVANALLEKIEEESLGGLWAAYIAEKKTTLWDVTDNLQKSLKTLNSAIAKVPVPAGIDVTGTTSGGRNLTFKDKETVNAGESVQLNAKILPEGANQEVDFELLLGDGVSVSDTGLVTAAKACSLVMIKVSSKEDPLLTKMLKLEFKEAPAADHSARIETIMDSIAKSYIENSGEWQVMEMAAYLKYKPDTANKTSDKAKQNFINKAIKTISTSESDTELDKAILGLRGLNADLAKLYAVNSNTPLNAIDKLSSVKHNSSAWSAPYTLAAYNQGIANKEKEEALLAQILKAQNAEGAWDEFGTIDTTANVIAGLSFYKEREDVKEAIDRGINYLASKQETSGAYNDGFNGINSNSTAMVIVGLAAAGVNPDTDVRFIKNGRSALDGLMSFALEDNSGFGHKNNTTVNQGSNEQAFRALIAASNIMKDGKAYNIYDFSANAKEPARATGEGNVDKPAVPEGDDIAVTMSIKADTGYWMNNATVSIPGKNARVYHAFVKGCKEYGITYTGAESGYVSSMTKNGITLSEFDKGANSGWMYKVNGELPAVSLTEKDIKNGDNIVWFYTNDWTREPGAFVPEDNKGVSTEGSAGSAVTTTPTEVTITGDTAKVTVKPENMTEAIKQAQENKSKEIVLEVKKEDTKGAENIKLQIDVSFVKKAEAADTAITVDTENGMIKLDDVVLEKIITEAKGKALTFEVSRISRPDEIQQKAAGKNGCLLRLNIKCGNNTIADFGKGIVKVTVAVPANLYGKKVAAVHIADNGKVEKLAGKLLKKGGKQHYEFTTSHFSTFALVDVQETGLEKEELTAEQIRENLKTLKPAARSVKTAKKNVIVRVNLSKTQKEIIENIEAAGYDVKYHFYRSQNKQSKYEPKLKTAGTRYVNTAGKKGRTYYYKVRVQIYDENGKLIAKTSLQNCKSAARVWTK